MATGPRVALLIETSRGYGRQLLRGIVRYARLHGPWAFYVTPGDFEQALPKMERWGGTGIIARIETPAVARAIRATGLPVIGLDLSERQLRAGSPWANTSEVCPDSPAAARMAADHLVERGFLHFGFVGIPGRLWSRARQRGFCERLGELELPCEVYAPPARRGQSEWSVEQQAMAQWLRSLPKPVGLMACNDDRGRQVLEACQAAGLRVPDDVAVVGMDDDELLCELAGPPLSSVALNAERAGYEAAELLDGLMSGRVKQPRRIVVEPLWVTTRQSTDVLALADREVAAALRFIREQADRPIQVRDVVREVGRSRRSLEIRFRRAIGRSVHAEIQRVHLERAKRFLVETDLPTPTIAEASGFGSASYLGMVFRRRLGMTPSQYRTRARSR